MRKPISNEYGEKWQSSTPDVHVWPPSELMRCEQFETHQVQAKVQGQCLFLLPLPYSSMVNIFNHLGTFTSFLPCWETAELSVSLVHLCLSLLSPLPYFLFPPDEERPAERILSYPCGFFVDHSIQGVRQETNLPDIFQTWSVMGMWTFWSLCLGIRTDGGFPGDGLSCVYLKMLKNHNLVCLS